MTNPKDDFPEVSNEPVIERMCRARLEGFSCTRTRGHAGDHVAHGDPLRVLCSWPQIGLSDALNGDGFPVHGPRTPLSDAVLHDALDRLREPAGKYICKDCGCPVVQLPPDFTDGRWIHASCADGLACVASKEQARTQRRVAREVSAAWDAMVNGQETL